MPYDPFAVLIGQSPEQPDTAPSQTQEQPQSGGLCRGDSCGDFTAGWLNPPLKAAGLPTLETGGLAVDTPVQYAHKTGAKLYRDSETPFTPEEMSKWDEGTFMVGGTGGKDSHSQQVGYNNKGEKGIISWANGAPYWETFEDAHRKIRATGWKNYTAVDPMSALNRRAEATGASADTGVNDGYVRSAVAAANKYGIDPDIYVALIQQESGFKPNAKSSTGVRGISQMTLATGKSYGINNEDDRSDPEKMLDAGAHHLANLYKENGGNWPAAINAYNGGSDPNYLMNVGRHIPWAQAQIGRIGSQPQEAIPDTASLDPFAGLAKSAPTTSTQPQPSAAPAPPGGPSGTMEDWERDQRQHKDFNDPFASLVKTAPPGPPHAPVIPSQDELMGMVQHATMEPGNVKQESLVLPQTPDVTQDPYAGFGSPVYPERPKGSVTITPAQSKLDADIEEGRRYSDTLAQFGTKVEPAHAAIILNVPFIPLEYAISEVGKRTLRPVMDYAFPKAPEADKDMAENGLENLATLGLIPSYLTGLGLGLDFLKAAGYKYAPDFVFKPGAKIGLPEPVPLSDVKMARVNEFAKAKMAAARAQADPVAKAAWERDEVYRAEARVEAEKQAAKEPPAKPTEAPPVETKATAPTPTPAEPQRTFTDEQLRSLEEVQVEALPPELQKAFYLEKAALNARERRPLKEPRRLSQYPDVGMTEGGREFERKSRNIQEDQGVIEKRKAEGKSYWDQIKEEDPESIRTLEKNRVAQALKRGESLPDTAGKRTGALPGQMPETQARGWTLNVSEKAPAPQPKAKEPGMGETEIPLPGLNVQRIPVSQIKTAPDLFQYKVGYEEKTGAGLALKDVQKWDEGLSGIVTLYREKDGNMFVVNGHQRLSLAKKYGVDSLRAQVLDSSEWTPLQARAYGAKINIAEGRGTEIDAAKFFRDSGLNPQDLAEQGLSLSEAKTRRSIALSQLSDPIFHDAALGRITPDRAVLIGEELAGNEPAQEALYSYLKDAEKKGKDIANTKLRELIRLGKGAGAGQRIEKQATLFGEEELAKSNMLEAADLSAYAKKTLTQDKNLFGVVGRKAGKLETAGNVINIETNQAISQEAAQALDLFNKFAYYGDTATGQVLAKYADTLATAKNKAEVRKEFYDALKGAISEDRANFGLDASRRASLGAEGPQVSGPVQEGGGRTSGGEGKESAPSTPIEGGEWGLEPPQARVSPLETRLNDLQKTFPDIDRIKASQVIQALPGADDSQVAAMVSDPDLFSQVARGNLSATERTQLLSKANDVSKQEALPGMGGGGLFDTKYRPKTSLESPTFFSKLEQVAGDKLPGKGPASQMADTLESWAKKGLFKPDELKWSGIIPYLREHGGTVARQDVLDKLKENQVEVRVVEHREEIDQATQDKIDELNDKALVYLHKGDAASIREHNKLKKEIDELHKKTKFKSYMRLPAGLTNYLEVLLTLPEKETLKNRTEFGEILKQKYGEKYLDAIDNWTEEERQRYFKLPGRAFEERGPATFRITGVHAYGDQAADVNRFAHMFLTDAEIDGKKYLVVTELQSDWAQKGRKEGYQLTAQEKERLQSLRNQLEPLEKEKGKELKRLEQKYGDVADYYVGDKAGQKLPDDFARFEELKTETLPIWNEIDSLSPRTQRGAPPFPFPKTWHEVALKKALRMAADQGYDGLAVVNGDMVKDRYDLSKQIDSLDILHNGYQEAKGTFDIVAEKDGHVVISEKEIPKEKLSEYVGKEIAERAIVETELPGTSVTYSGLDFKVGGEWANRFYDQTVPQFLGKYGKQFGARVHEVDARGENVLSYDDIQKMLGDHGKYPIGSPEREALKRQQETAPDYGHLPFEGFHAMTFTPEMLSAVQQPQPLFKPKEVTDEKEPEAKSTGVGREPVARNAYNPENDLEAGRDLRNLKSHVAETHSPEDWEHWRDIKDATSKPANARIIDKLAEKHGLPVVWVKNANFAGSILDTKDGRVIVIDEEVTGVSHLSTARHEIFHHLVKNFDQDAYDLIGLVDTDSPAFKEYAKAYRGAMGAATGRLDDMEVAEELSADWYSGVEDLNGMPLRNAFGNRGKAFKARERIMNRPSYKPRKMPPTDDEEEPLRTTGIKNAVTEAERIARGKVPVEIELAMRRAHPEAYKRGKDLVDNGEIDPRFFARTIAENKGIYSSFPYGMAEAQMVLLYDRAVIQNEIDDALNRLEKAQASGDKVREMEEHQRMAKLEDDYDFNDRADRMTGYEAGLGLGIRRLMVKQDYSLARTMQRARVATGLQELPEALREELTKVTKELQEALKKIETYEDEKKQQEAEKTAGQLERKVRHVIRGEELKKKAKGERSAKFKSLAAQLNAALYHANMVFDPDAIKILGEMAKELVIGCITDAREIVSEIYGELQELTPNPDLTERDVRDAVSQYGVTSKLSLDEVNVALREAKRQMRLFSALEDATAGEVPLRSGFQRDAITDEVRELSRQVRQAMRESGIDSTRSRSPEEQWKTSLDAAKTHVRNWLRDLKRQIENKKRDPKSKKGFEYDQELKELKAEAKQLEQVLEEIDAKPGITDEQRVKMAVAAAERSYDEYERRIREGDLEPKKKESQTPDTPEVKFARGRRDIIKDIWQQMVKDAKPARDPEAQARKAFKTRTLKRIADLQEMKDTGNFEKSARRVLKLDAEEMRLKNQAEKLKEEIDNIIYKRKLANRTRIEKNIDRAVKVRRAVILSGVGTVIKLTSAAAVRTVSTPLEEVTGLVITRLPYLRQIAAKAPRYGRGLNVRAEAAAIRQWFEKESYLDMVDIIKTGRSSLDRLYGNKKDLPPEITDMIGHFHYVFKSIPKRAEFYRSLQHLTEWAIQNDYDMTDPATLMFIHTWAYMEANRAIFLQDNMAVDAYRNVIRGLQNYKKSGSLELANKVAAATIQILLPIVKVPTNFVSEASEWLLGIPQAAIRMHQRSIKAPESPGMIRILPSKTEPDAWRSPETRWERMVANLTLEDADAIMRKLRRGFLGPILLALGMALGLYGIAGGYFRRNEKRKAKEVGPDEMLIKGKTIPSITLHNPPTEVIQMGATMVRVANYNAQYNATHAPEDRLTHPYVAGAFEAGKGILRKVPFFDEPIGMAEGIMSPESAGRRFNMFLEGLLVPPDVRRIAKWQDTVGDQVMPRETKNLKQTFQASIPGLRKDLPIDVGKISRMDISKVAELVENAPEGTFKGSTATDIRHIMLTKIKESQKSGESTLEERDEYRRIADKLDDFEPKTPSKVKRTKNWLMDHPENKSQVGR